MKNSLKKNLNYLVAFLLVILLLFLFFNKSDKKPLQPAVQFISAPFAAFFSKTGYWLEEKVDFFSSIGELKEQNQNLHRENLSLKSELAEFKNLENENKELRSQLELAPREKYDLEASLILGRDVVNGREVVFLGKGKKDGIEKGMPVIVSQGILIGKITKVFSGSCEAELIFSRENNINAEIVESETKGIVHGEYGMSVVMDMIPQSVEIKRDQTVVTSGLGGNYPGGLLIGYTKNAMDMADQLFQKVSLSLPIEIEDLGTVWVIKGENKLKLVE